MGRDGKEYRIDVRTQTDAAGRFTLSPLPWGRAALVFFKTDYQVYDSAFETDPIFRKEVKIVMMKAGRIQGRIVDPDGKSVTRIFHVELNPPAGKKDKSRVRMTDCENGHFELTGISRGEYVLTARRLPKRKGEVSSSKPVSVEAGKTVEVEITYSQSK